jgi:hypothetical protein
VGLETGTSAFYVARAAAALHLTPIVVDAHEVRRKAHRLTQKSDRRDAFEVCDGVRRGLYRSVVHIPSPAISALRTALSRRRHFVRIQTAEVNAAKRLLRGAGWLVGTRTSLRSATSWDRLLHALTAAPELEGHARNSVLVGAIRSRSSRWLTGSAGCCTPCCEMGRTFSPPVSAWKRAPCPNHHAPLSLDSEAGRASHLCLMRRRSPLRVHDGAGDPVFPHGPRAQETVWGLASRIESWGGHDPEWTAGDDAGERTPRCVPSVPRPTADSPRPP